MLRHLIKANLKRKIFANEKPFKLQTPYDTQNNRVYAKHRKKKQILDVKTLWCLLEYPCAVRQVFILLSQKCGWMGCTFAHKCRKSLSLLRYASCVPVLFLNKMVRGAKHQYTHCPTSPFVSPNCWNLNFDHLTAPISTL